jgi:hypothetical protein
MKEDGGEEKGLPIEEWTNQRNSCERGLSQQQIHHVFVLNIFLLSFFIFNYIFISFSRYCRDVKKI